MLLMHASALPQVCAFSAPLYAESCARSCAPGFANFCSAICCATAGAGFLCVAAQCCMHGFVGLSGGGGLQPIPEGAGTRSGFEAMPRACLMRHTRQSRNCKARLGRPLALSAGLSRASTCCTMLGLCSMASGGMSSAVCTLNSCDRQIHTDCVRHIL